jgi:DNA-binding winged helix-turn-helix (wHTH) protein
LIQPSLASYKRDVPREPHRFFPPYRLDPANAQLWRDEEEISLRPKTFDVLRYLVDHPGLLVTKGRILDVVWPGVAVSDTMPATCIAELRRALGDDAKTPRFIETVHRRGYRFIAPVTTATASQARRKASSESNGPKPIIVGRDEELSQLRRWYSQVLEGRRQIVFVAGEAGIGKTTFVQAFIDSIAHGGAAHIGRGQCVEQYGAGEPYMPIFEALSRLSHEPLGDTLVDILHKFAPTWLAQMPELLTSEERSRLQAETQGITQQRMLREMMQALEAIAAELPLVLVIEDLHWSDFSTLGLISAIAAKRTGPAVDTRDLSAGRDPGQGPSPADHEAGVATSSLLPGVAAQAAEQRQCRGLSRAASLARAFPTVRDARAGSSCAHRRQSAIHG